MSVSVSMPQLGESVTEGTVTRWLKKEGERVEVDEPLLEVSTDKVDTEIPSPASGILRSIAVDEDETVAVGAQLAVIEDSETSDSAPAQDQPARPGHRAAAGGRRIGAGWRRAGTGSRQRRRLERAQLRRARPARADPGLCPAAVLRAARHADSPAPVAALRYASSVLPLRTADHAGTVRAGVPGRRGGRLPRLRRPPEPTSPRPTRSTRRRRRCQERARRRTSLPWSASSLPSTPWTWKPSPGPASAGGSANRMSSRRPACSAGRRLKHLRRRRMRRRLSCPSRLSASGWTPASGAQPPAAPAAGRPAVVPSSLRGTTQRMSRPRQVIAQRMVESLRVSAQLTTVVEADVTAIARLRDRAKADFEAREGVKLTFLPFFALAAVEALKMHPKLNAVIDGDQVTYNDAEHLGVAVDTERGLMVPVIHNAGDLNIGGLARKIGDLAQRTRSGQVGPDELAGGTFTLTNTGSRGALFDTPIINQPQVAILGTGTVVRRPVVVEDPALGEVIAVRSMVYLALTYDHRLVDGADAARFLTTVKNRLEEGAFETELGL